MQGIIVPRGWALVMVDTDNPFIANSLLDKDKQVHEPAEVELIK